MAWRSHLGPWDDKLIFVTKPSDVIFVWFYHRETSNLKDSARDADDDDDEDDDEDDHLVKDWVALCGRGGGRQCQQCNRLPHARTHVRMAVTRSQSRCLLECCEKYKSFKSKIPQPDSERRHSPDFRTVFGIMIGSFSSCEIGKTWGTNKQVNKQTNKNWLFHFCTTRLPTTSE